MMYTSLKTGTRISSFHVIRKIRPTIYEYCGTTHYAVSVVEHGRFAVSRYVPVVVENENLLTAMVYLVTEKPQEALNFVTTPPQLPQIHFKNALDLVENVTWNDYFYGQT
jgi:hypothetical protein